MKMKHRRRIATMILALGVILTSLSGYVCAKYVKVVPFKETVTIKADIGTIVLQEHEVKRKPDGSYYLTDAVLVGGSGNGNTYTLIPGLDVPKDPHVVITKPNNLPVYVYVEIVSKLSTAVTFEEAEKWKKLDDVTGPKGGEVYVYEDQITNADKLEIFILKDNKVTVGQKLLSGDKTTGLELDFYAYMYQTAAGVDAKEVFQNCNK